MYVCEQAPSPKTLCKCPVYGVFDYVLLCIATSVISMSCVCGLIGNWFMIIWDYIVGSFYGHLYIAVLASGLVLFRYQVICKYSDGFGQVTWFGD